MRPSKRYSKSSFSANRKNPFLEAARTPFARTSFIDAERTTVHFLAIQLFDCVQSHTVVFDFNETEALAATRIAVHDDLCALDFAELFEQLAEVSVTECKGEITNINAFHNESRLLNKPNRIIAQFESGEKNLFGNK